MLELISGETGPRARLFGPRFDTVDLRLCNRIQKNELVRANHRLQREHTYAETRARLSVDGDYLVNRQTGRRFSMGRLEVISLAALRDRAGPLLTANARTSLESLHGDIRELHLAPEQHWAMMKRRYGIGAMAMPFAHPTA